MWRTLETSIEHEGGQLQIRVFEKQKKKKEEKWKKKEEEENFRFINLVD